MIDSPTPTPPLNGRGYTSKTPPLQGRGKGWGIPKERLAILQEHARQMRNNPTEPEKRLWRNLSNGQLDGHKFRRQSVVGYFIADFVCPHGKLIVEVDGDTHDEAKDRVRDDILGEHSYRVIRVTNQDVMSNMDGVLAFISGALCSGASPHPNPSPEGEGLNVLPPSPSKGALGKQLKSDVSPAESLT